MHHSPFVLLVAICAIASATTTHAQHAAPQHSLAQPIENDGRVFVPMPAPMVEHMLGNMRDHLQAVHEIQSALSTGDTDRAASVAEHRLGMTAMQAHGAHEMSRFMPAGMQEAGSAMHRAASRLAVTAKDVGVTGDLKPALSALAAVTAQCIACHAGFRVK